MEDVQQMESSSKGAVKGSLMGNYFRSGGHPLVLFIVIVLFIMAQLLASASDYWVSFWTSQEELRVYYSNNNGSSVDELTQSQMQNSSVVQDVNNSTSYVAQPDNKPSILSTETCMYIHGGLMLSLFTIAITR